MLKETTSSDTYGHNITGNEGDKTLGGKMNTAHSNNHM